MVVKISIFLFAVVGCTFAYPRPQGSSNETEPEYFWYMTDNGEVVKAYLAGGPPPVSMDNVQDKVEFWLYKNGRDPGVQIHPGCADCLGTYVSGAPLVVLSHGFSSNHEGNFGETHREVLSKRTEPINVVFINWGKLASAPNYAAAAGNVDPVGKYSAQLLDFLIEKKVTSVDKIHFIGHSLGSHVGNHVGRNVGAGKIGRITALDPALPLFGDKDDSQRIDPSDAQFVDVIHTAMGKLPSGLAFTEPRGHVDFYPNSGKDQPGCGADLFGSCSHGRANSFFAESVVNPKAFVACKCNNWDDYNAGRCLCLEQEYMGWATPSSARGLYYLRTNSKSPYGQN